MEKKKQTTVGGVGGPDVKPKVGMGQDDTPNHPLYFSEILARICVHLPFESVKNARLVNHLWYKSSSPTWTRRSQICIKDIHHLRDFLAKTACVRKVMPFTVSNWTFQGESMIKLWMDQGLAEQDLMKPFWGHVKNLTLSEWMKRRFRYVEHNPDPNRPHRVEYRKVPYFVLTKIGSAYGVTSTLKLCTNLAQMVIHYPLLTTMKGAYIGKRQFPELEKLSRLEIYFEGTKWSNHVTPNPDELLSANLTESDVSFAVPQEVSGGNTLVLRLLDHSPNLTSIALTSGTIMTSKVENWFLGHLFSETVTLPKLEELRCSIPLEEDICTALRTRKWGLRALHLKTLPGTGRVTAKVLHDMLDSFRGTLKHLELVFIGIPDVSGGLFFSGNILCNLETLELWGHSGSHAFVKGLTELKKAVIGGVDIAGFQRLRMELGSYYRPGLELKLKDYEDFIQRLDEGPKIL